MKLIVYSSLLAVMAVSIAIPLNDNTALPPGQLYSYSTGEYTTALAQLGDEDKSLKARLFKWINMTLDAVYGLGCKFTGCLEPEPMYLAKMWHLMKAHRKRTKITKIIPTWPSPQLAPPAPSPVVVAAPAPVAPSTPGAPVDPAAART